MITLKSCPNCDSQRINEYRVLSGGGYLAVQMIPGVTVNAQLVTRYCVCQNCHLIFQNPRLSDTELNTYYDTGYYRRTINPPPEGMDKSEEDRAKLDAEIIKKYIDKVTSHFDIGCGRGYLLEEVGAKIKVGTESDIDYVRAKGVKVYSDMDKVPPKKFGLVTAIHTLEHVPYPLEYLKTMVKFLDKEGFCVIEVPSFKTRGGPLGFAHLSHFEPDVLRYMCREVGLSILETKFTPHLLLICKLDHK